MACRAHHSNAQFTGLPALLWQVLREASRVCKPDGKILLLEHGRGYYDWLNERLDSSAENHHRKWGCWWNKDIEALIAEVGGSSVQLHACHGLA